MELPRAVSSWGAQEDPRARSGTSRCWFHHSAQRREGSHRKLTHPRYPGAVTLSGQDGDDAKPYQERAVRKALEEIDR